MDGINYMKVIKAWGTSYSVGRALEEIRHATVNQDDLKTYNDYIRKAIAWLEYEVNND